MGQRDPFAQAGTITRLPGGFEYAADELRVALVWTRRAAEAAQRHADRLTFELPLVHAALGAGEIDPPEARVFEHHLRGGRRQRTNPPARQTSQTRGPPRHPGPDQS